jgi:DUF3096 family protein
MHLTIAHISPIMSLIAGVLILIMPRLLNFIVAIFLILNGLLGLGLLQWLHFSERGTGTVLLAPPASKWCKARDFSLLPFVDRSTSWPKR